MKPVILDTDVLSFFLKGDPRVTEIVSEYLIEHDRLIITRVTQFEILAGLEYKNACSQLAEFKKFARQCIILNITQKSITKSAKIYGELRRNGIQIGTPDLLIAGIAIENNFELITNNEKHYQPIEELMTNNWKK